MPCSSEARIFSPPGGKRYARVPCDFSALCKAAGLNLYERSVLLSLLCFQIMGANGGIVLRSGTDEQIAADTGISPSNVRKTLSALREKGIIQTVGTRKHLLILDIWGSGTIASQGKRFKGIPNESESPEKQEVHLDGSGLASDGKRCRVSTDAHKEGEGGKNHEEACAQVTLLDP